MPEALAEGELVNGIAVAGTMAASTVPTVNDAARAIEANFLKAPTPLFEPYPFSVSKRRERGNVPL
jgi:hypothetical protein